MLIPAMKTTIDHSSAYGVESFVMGMPHRYISLYLRYWGGGGGGGTGEGLPSPVTSSTENMLPLVRY